MARIFHKPETEAAAKAWMHDVMITAGVIQKSQRSSAVPTVLFTRSYNVPVNETKDICDELINRDFKDIDSSIRRISNYSFYPSLKNSCSDMRYSPEYVAKAIVFMAECFGLYWDDTIRTPYEVEEFQKTLLGQTVYKYGRYISSIKDPAAKKRTSPASSGSPKVAPSASKNDFRQQGPKSSQATGLVNLDGTPIQPGQPGQKVYIDKGYALAIRGTVAGKASEVRAVISPLNSKGASGSKNKVLINASHGYGVAECLFDEMDDAVNFYNQLVANDRVPAGVANLQIKRIGVDKNGYFLADTEFGICAIAARVLNEEVDEQPSIEEDLSGGWKKATEKYNKKELNELHDWMRRD